MKPPKDRRRSTGQLPHLSLGLSLAATTAAAPFPSEDQTALADPPEDSCPPLEGIKEQIRLMFQNVHTSAAGNASSPKPQQKSSGSSRRSSVSGPVLAQPPREGIMSMRRGSESSTVSAASFLNTSFDDQPLEAMRIPNPAFYMRESHFLERQVSYEEELERKTWTLREVALSWKHRWQKERNERKLMAQHMVVCEQECVHLIQTQNEQHDLRLKVMDDDYAKHLRICEDINREKSTLEAAFRRSLEDLEQTKAENVKRKTEFNRNLAGIQRENGVLQIRLSKMEQENTQLRADNEKLERRLEEVAKQTNPGSGASPDKWSDYYKMLLDVAINKVKHVEDTHVCNSKGSRSAPQLGVPRRNSTENVSRSPQSAPLGMYRIGVPDVNSWDSMSSLESQKSEPNEKSTIHAKKQASSDNSERSLQSWPELPECNFNHGRHVSDPVAMLISSNPEIVAHRQYTGRSESTESGYQTLNKTTEKGQYTLSHSHSEDNLMAVAVSVESLDDPPDDAKYNTISSNRKREKRSTSVGTVSVKVIPERRSNSCTDDLEKDVLSLSENNLLDIANGNLHKGKKGPKSKGLTRWQDDLKKTLKIKRRHFSDLGAVFKSKPKERDSSSFDDGDVCSVTDGRSSNSGSIDTPDEDIPEEKVSKTTKSGFKGLTSRRNGVALQMADQLMLSEGLKRKSKGNILEKLKTWKTTPHTQNSSNNNNVVQKKAKDQRKNFGKV